MSPTAEQAAQATIGVLYALACVAGMLFGLVGAVLLYRDVANWVTRRYQRWMYKIMSE